MQTAPEAWPSQPVERQLTSDGAAAALQVEIQPCTQTLCRHCGFSKVPQWQAVVWALHIPHNSGWPEAPAICL